MPITIINDCRDDNAASRQLTRAMATLNMPASFIGVKNDIEAAGNIIDTLDALDGKDGVILVNVAPRHGKAKKWKNGTPFGYFWYGDTLVVSTIDGLTLSLVKKFGLTETVNVMDIPTSLSEMIARDFIPQSLMDEVTATQFRSLNFVPRVAGYLHKYRNITSEVLSLSEIEDAPQAVWWVDVFGNAKLTAIEGELDELAKTVEVNGEKIPFYERLKDVPNDELGVVVGSSGFKNKRFYEIVIQGASAAEKLSLTSGSSIT